MKSSWHDPHDEGEVRKKDGEQEIQQHHSLYVPPFLGAPIPHRLDVILMQRFLLGIDARLRLVGLSFQSDEYDDAPTLLLDEKGMTKLLLNLQKAMEELRKLPVPPVDYSE